MMVTMRTHDAPPQGPPEDRVSATAGESAYEALSQRERKRVRALAFYTHLAIYLVVNLFMFADNMLTDSQSLWFYWPLLAWGTVVAIQGLLVFGPLAVRGRRWEERKIQEYMAQDR